MKVNVEFVGFRFAMKETAIELDVPGMTFPDVVHELAAKVRSFREGVIDESGNIDSSIVILVNGEEVAARDRLDETTLGEGDTVTFMMMAGGG